MIEELEYLASYLEQQGNISEIGPYPLCVHIIQDGSTKYTLKMQLHPFYIRLRINKLIKAINRVKREDNARNNKPRKFQMKQPKFSKTIAQEFLDDDEFENCENYCAIYNVRLVK